MGLLTREMIFAADDLQRELVAVPEWGGDVYVRMLSGGERELFEQWFNEERDRRYLQEDKPRNFRTRLALLTVCDAEGRPLFTLPDLEALAAKSFAPIERIFQVARRLNRLGIEEEEALRAAVGESAASLNGASGSV